MPEKVTALNIAAVVLQYTFVIIIYLFLYKVIIVAGRDIGLLSGARTQETKRSHEPVRLMVTDSGGIHFNQTMFFLKDSLTIGRGEQNDITINDSFVSYEHACVTRYKNTFVLADLNSTNGTFHNGQRIADEVPIQFGDNLKIGPVTFRFER